MPNQANIERFESLLSSVNRPGIDKLLDFIRHSDFYTAPASSRFHGDHEGGLLEHTLNVYDCLVDKKNSGVWAEKLKEYSDESLILVALLHDLCKTYMYGSELKNKKVYSETGTKKDSGGRYDWKQEPVYVIDNKYPLGHGEKSVFFILQYVKLNMSEIAAIRWHMGAYCDASQWNELGTAYEKWPICLALHEADMEATHLLEVE